MKPRPEKGGFMRGLRVERLDHLGIVAGVCQEIALAAYVDALAGPSQQQVSIGTATMAMILNGLGFSNRRLYLVPQFFATKAVERLLGPGITAEDLNDDCLGRALDWLYAHDPTTLFAGIALRARRAFGIRARQVHVDTTSFSVTGEYEADLDAHTLAVTYGYSRDHRADLKQWMLALATTRQGDVPLFCQALDGNVSDKVSLVAAVQALAEQLQTAEEDEAPVFVADSGLYSAQNVARLTAADVRWISRVPDTSQEARAALDVTDAAWQHAGPLFWAPVPQAPSGERWVVVRTIQGQERARATLERQVEQTRAQWEKALWHLGNQRFAGEPDAQAALTQQLKKRPEWLTGDSHLIAHSKQTRPGRPRKDLAPERTQWHIEASVAVDADALTRAVQRKASFLVATNVLNADHLSDQELIQTYKDQHSLERGFSFLKDPLFLASSVFVKKPERIVALSLVMVLCLLVYRLAEHRLREQLAATGQTVPSQVNKPTDRPTMRWIFQCFEGVDLLHIRHGPDSATAVVLRLEPFHQQVLALLGSSCEELYQSTNRTCGQWGIMWLYAVSGMARSGADIEVACHLQTESSSRSSTMGSSQTRQGALRCAAALLLLAVLAALPGCGSQTTATTRPTATAVVATATPMLAAGSMVTARVVGVSMFSATSGWGSIASPSSPSSYTGVAYTVDGGRTWYNMTPAGLTGLTLEYPSTIALSARSAAEAWTWLSSFNSNSTTLWHTTDAGVHWSSSAVATAEVGQLDFSDSLHGWLDAEPGGAAAGEYSIDVWRTTDGGATWAQVSPYYVGPAGPTGISFANATTGFAGGCPAGGHPSSPINLCVTRDAGNTWSAQSSPIPPGSEPADLLHVYAELPVFISATAGVLEVIDLSNSSNPQLGSLYVYRTTDVGLSWHGGAVLGGTSAITIPESGVPSSVLPTGEVFVAATVHGQMTLYQLPLGTNTWTKIATAASSTTLLAGMTQLDFVNQMTGWAVTNAGLIATTDGGVTWAVRHA